MPFEVRNIVPNRVDRISMSPLDGLARGLTRGIVCAGVIWCAAPLARAIEVSCALASGEVTPPTTGVTEAGVPLIARIGEMSGVLADGLVSVSLLAGSALAALALGSFFVIVRGCSPRAGAATASLAIFGSIAFAREDMGAVLATNSASILHILVPVLIVIASALICWRWIEDVALAAALAPAVDPLSIDAATDHEASDSARKGPIARDAASRQLRGALGFSGSSEVIDEPGLHGRGSPIPRVMPDDGPISRVA